MQMRRLPLIAVGLAAVLSAGPERAPTAAFAQPESGLTYRLVDTWADAPWQLTAGRFGHVQDVSSAPDGTVYVLDATHGAVHILSPDGTPRSVFLVPPLPPSVYNPSGRVVQRMDVSADGTLLLISALPRGVLDDGGWFERLSPVGQRLAGRELDRVYSDVAAGPDGTAYLSRTGPVELPTPVPGPDQPIHPGGVDVFDASDRLRERIEHPAVFYALGVDVDADGTVYIVNRVPSPWDYEAPRPEPTEEPSLLGRPAQTTPPEAVEGVVIFGSDHRYRETVPFVTPEDVAVGPAGVFVSRNVEVFALRESEPMYSGSPGQLVVGFADGFVLHLDVPADGTLIAGMAHCYHQGVVRFNDPRARPAVPTYSGSLDRPDLEGPIAPWRIAVGDELAVLQGRFAVAGARPDRSYVTGDTDTEPQSVQRWNLRGGLGSQLGVCAGSMSGWMSDRTSALWVNDVAVDRGDVYTVEPALLHLRQGPRFPAATFWPGALYEPGVEPHMTAVAADGGVAAALDAGAGRVVIVDRTGRARGDWPLVSGSNTVPSDLALAGNRLYIADAGANRVRVHDLDGRLVTEVATHDAPWRIDASAAGDLFVLGRRGWATRYDSTGALTAGWPMPDPEATALDIAAGDDGRVYVAFSKREADRGPDRTTVYRLLQAGVWVFEPVIAPPRVEPPPDGCLVHVDKWATPATVRLGETVDVHLDVRGSCPGSYAPVQLALLMDTSRSMNRHDLISQARSVAIELLSALDGTMTQVALLTFDDAGALAVPLTLDHAAMAARIAALPATGDTRMASGLDAARSELIGPRGDPRAERRILIVTDGEYKDDVAEAVRDVSEAGIEMTAIVLPQGGMTGIPATFERLTGNPPLVHPDGEEVRALASRLAHFTPELGLFDRLVVTDVVPANMRYVVGSADPPAMERIGALQWSFDTPVPAERDVYLRYTLTPLETGLWPTNASAEATYTDVQGHEGAVAFPVPIVKVWDTSSLIEHVYLPLTSSRACFRGKRAIDIVLVIDASVSMGDSVPSGGTKLGSAQAAAGRFLDLLRLPTDRAAVVSFSSGARTHVDLTGDRAALGRALDALSVSPGTQIDEGLIEARRVLSVSGRAAAQPVVVVLTDGLQSGATDGVIAAADGLRASGVVVFAIGLGEGVDADLLRAVATTPGDYLHSPTADELAAAYRLIVESLACRVE